MGEKRKRKGVIELRVVSFLPLHHHHEEAELEGEKRRKEKRKKRRGERE